MSEQSSTSQVKEQGAVKYDERQKLDEIADKYENISNFEYLKDKAAHPLLLVMEETPQMLVDLMKRDGLANVKSRKILIRKDALYLAIREEGIEKGHYHNLGAETLKQLPDKIKDPDVVLKTDGKSKRRLLLTHVKSGNGEAVISIEFEAPKEFEGKNDRFNIIITVFDLHKNYLKGLFDKHDAVVEYEKEDLTQVNPQLYEWLRTINVRSSKENIAQQGENVKYQLRDSNYFKAVSDGDMETAQRLVDEAAKDAGYNSPMLYHGTGAFGFTEFDLSKMDDKRSIFLTDSERIASTYSGVEGKREIGKKEKPIENLSLDELAEELNRYQGENEMQFTYLQDKEKTVWEATLNVTTTANSEKILYDIFPIKNVERSIESDTTSTNKNISQLDDYVKRQERLPMEDRNRLSVLGGKKDRLSSDLKTLEKAFGKLVKEEFEKNIAPNEITEYAKKAPIRVLFCHFKRLLPFHFFEGSIPIMPQMVGAISIMFALSNFSLSISKSVLMKSGMVISMGSEVPWVWSCPP